MVVKETVLFLLLMMLPVAMEAKGPVKPRVSLPNLSASSLAQEDDAGNGESLQEDIKEIKKLVQQKRFRKKRKTVLKLLDKLSVKAAEPCKSRVQGKVCNDIKEQADSRGDGMYLLDPDGGNQSNAFQAYCDMTSYGGGWTMCYTTDDKVKPRTEVTYSSKFPYGTDGYRTNCNNIPFTEIIFIDHQTGSKTYFKRKSNLPITAAANYGKTGSAYGLWDGVGTNKAYSYQLLICDHSFYSGFFVSGYTNCYKQCNNWCGDRKSSYFRTASTDLRYKGVAFNTNGHHPNVLGNRLISVGLR